MATATPTFNGGRTGGGFPQNPGPKPPITGGPLPPAPTGGRGNDVVIPTFNGGRTGGPLPPGPGQPNPGGPKPFTPSTVGGQLTDFSGKPVAPTMPSVQPNGRFNAVPIQGQFKTALAAILVQNQARRG